MSLFSEPHNDPNKPAMTPNTAHRILTAGAAPGRPLRIVGALFGFIAGAGLGGVIASAMDDVWMIVGALVCGAFGTLIGSAQGNALAALSTNPQRPSAGIVFGTLFGALAGAGFGLGCAIALGGAGAPELGFAMAAGLGIGSGLGAVVGVVTLR